MKSQTLANMRVVLDDNDLGGRISVPLESFMRFDLEISRELQQLEERWHHLFDDGCFPIEGNDRAWDAEFDF